MGDWIWVLITALITFVGISFINVNPTHESTQLFLEFPDQVAQSETDSLLKMAIKESLWHMPSATNEPETATIDTISKNDSAAGERSDFGESTLGTPASRRSDMPWALIAAVGAILISVRVGMMFRRSASKLSHSTGMGSA